MLSKHLPRRLLSVCLWCVVGSYINCHIILRTAFGRVPPTSLHKSTLHTNIRPPINKRHPSNRYLDLPNDRPSYPYHLTKPNFQPVQKANRCYNRRNNWRARLPLRPPSPSTRPLPSPPEKTPLRRPLHSQSLPSQPAPNKRTLPTHQQLPLRHTG